MAGPEQFHQSRINPKFLETNATAHTWPFSAVAELIDNAYDSGVSASELHIDKEDINGKPCLTFTDNGSGMDPEHLEKMLSFGFSEWERKDYARIGQFGNGFKSGSMRLAKDCVVFTVHQESKSASIGMLSRTFLEDRKAQTVVCPMIEYSLDGSVSTDGMRSSIAAILDVSPYINEEQLKEEIHRILLLGAEFQEQRSRSGTRIVLFNLKRTSEGLLELDFESDSDDIRYPETQPGSQQQNSYYQSLRRYCSILFKKPRIKISLRKQKVHSHLLLGSLTKKKSKVYKPSQATTPEKQPRSVRITFGVLTDEGKASLGDYGIMLYHNNRLIKPFEKLGCQKKGEERGNGVVGLVDVSSLMTPTHNKQDFTVDKEYSSAMTSFVLKLNDYCTSRVGGNQQPERITEPWTWVQCDNSKCLKWRRLRNRSEPLPEKWYCYMNWSDPLKNRCEIPEEEPSDDELPGKSAAEEKQPGTGRGRGQGKKGDSGWVVPSLAGATGRGKGKALQKATASIEKDSSGQKYSKQTHKRSPDSGYATANQPKKARPDVTAARQLFSSPATSTPTPVGPAASEGQPSSTSTTPSGEKEKPAQTDVSGHTGPKKGNKKFQLFKRNVYELLSYLQPLINWSRASTTSRPLEVGSEEDVQNTVKTWLSEYKKEKDAASNQTPRTQVSVSDQYGIPPPPVEPARQLDKSMDGVSEIFFDIETTGLKRGSSITQIAAVRGDEVINLFVMPDVPAAQPEQGRRPADRNFSPQDLIPDGGDNKILQRNSLSLHSAMEEFCAFLGQSSNNILVGHNIDTFDRPVLFRAMEKCDLLDRFCGLASGFMDTLKVLKQTHKGLTSYKQEDLVRNILGRDYKAHDAQGDALALQELMITAQPPVEVKQLASFSMQNAKYRFQRMCRIDCNKPSLQSMERMTSIPKRIAETIAASGLNEEHLKRVYNAAGESGICKVFTEPVNGKPRITKNQLIIKTVANYLGKLEEQLLLQH